MAMSGKYPVHPQMPTKGMPSKPTQWVQPCHLVTPYFTLQVQLAGLKPNKYRNQPLVSPAKGRSRATVSLTLFLLRNPIGFTLAIILRWLQNHNYNKCTQQPSLPLPVSRHKERDRTISERRVGTKEVLWGRVLTSSRTSKLIEPDWEGNSTKPKKAIMKA